MQMQLFDSGPRVNPTRAPALLEPAEELGPQHQTFSAGFLPGWEHSFHTGDKFEGGYGPTQLLATDYWTLRARSAELFSTNIYARGLIRRLVTNEINTGLGLEASPAASVIGLSQDEAEDWSEETEVRFELWANSAQMSDGAGLLTFGEHQAAARAEALVSGDVLCIKLQDKATRLPQVRLVPGGRVVAPLDAEPRRGNRIELGVEVDPSGRHVAFWVYDPNETDDAKAYSRVPATDALGEPNAWLLYGTDKRYGSTRGEPILSIMLQALKEIDRYKDAALRKAVVNSVFAVFIKRDGQKKSSLAGGATKRGTDSVVDTSGKERSFKVASYVPGVFIEGLEPGEEPQAFTNNGTDEKFGDFEDAMLRSIAWSQGIPPEILLLSFQSNYSASQAAINEFKLYLNPVRTFFGANFCSPYYEAWLLAELRNKALTARGLLEASRDPSKWAVRRAWTQADWSGQIKPSTDPLKTTRAMREQVEAGFITNARASRELNGLRFSRVVKAQIREQKLLNEVLRLRMETERLKNTPLTETKPEPAPVPRKAASLVRLDRV